MSRKSRSPEAAFRKAMRLSYPNHPEMFTLLHYEEWKPGIWKVTLLDQDLNPGDRVAAMLHASGKLWVGGYSEPAPAWAKKNPRTGYVASKIRANTARRNGGEPLARKVYDELVVRYAQRPVTGVDPMTMAWAERGVALFRAGEEPDNPEDDAVFEILEEWGVTRPA